MEVVVGVVVVVEVEVDVVVVVEVVVDVGVFRPAPGDQSTGAIANDAVMQV